MVGAFLLVALAGSVEPAGAPLQLKASAPAISATAQATASIRIISAVKFGQDFQSETPAGAARRSARLADADGFVKAAEILEFQ